MPADERTNVATSGRSGRRIVVPVVLAMVLAGCSGAPTEDDQSGQDATQPTAGEGDSDTDDTRDPSGPGDAEGASEDPAPEGDNVEADPSDTDADRGDGDGEDEPPAGEGSSSDDSAVTKTVAVPSIQHYGGEAAIYGTLRADPELDGGCFWLEREGAETGFAWVYVEYDEERFERYRVWARFYDDGSPAELIADDTVLAREGDEIEAAGGGWEIDRLDDSLAGEKLRCQLDERVVLMDLHSMTVVDGP